MTTSWPPTTGPYSRSQVRPDVLARINLLSTLADVGKRHGELLELLRHVRVGSEAIALATTVDRLASLADDLVNACLDAGCRPEGVRSSWSTSLDAFPGDD